MGATKIMIIRHAEKPGSYPVGAADAAAYTGVDPFGQEDPESLVTMGWERAGGIASLFAPNSGVFQNAVLAKPDFIYASSPLSGAAPAIQSNGNIIEKKNPSQRPYQTISALYAKMQLPAANLNISFSSGDFSSMVTSVLALQGIVLIAWQHQDILPKATGFDSIVNELMAQTNTPATSLQIPAGPWPNDRYDMIFVFDRPSGTGPFTAFTQVPQMLLAGDSTTLFPLPAPTPPPAS